MQQIERDSNSSSRQNVTICQIVTRQKCVTNTDARNIVQNCSSTCTGRRSKNVRQVIAAQYANCGIVANRGKIPISHELKERPVAANERSRAIGKLIPFKSGLLTLVDRLTRLVSKEVESALPVAHANARSREFQLHGNVTAREYFPKGYDFTQLSDEDLQAVVDQLNHRP